MYFDFQDKCMGFFERILSPSDHAWLQRINFLRKNYLTGFLERVYNFFSVWINVKYKNIYLIIFLKTCLITSLLYSSVNPVGLIARISFILGI